VFKNRKGLIKNEKKSVIYYKIKVKEFSR